MEDKTIEFKIWDDLEDTKSPYPFQNANYKVHGWTAKVFGEQEDSNPFNVLRIRFSKLGYRSMDLAVTKEFMALADDADVRQMFSQKIIAHQAEQDMLMTPAGLSLMTPAEEPKSKRSGPPPAPSGATLPQDFPMGGHPMDSPRPNITVNEVGIKASVSDVLGVTQLKDSAMLSMKQMREAMDTMMTTVPPPDIYSSIISPGVKRALMQDLMYPLNWTKDPTEDKPEAGSTGKWKV